MKEEEIIQRVFLNANNGLLGEITPNMRAIAISWNKTKELLVKTYYAEEPTEEDKEGIEAMIDEILANLIFDKIKSTYVAGLDKELRIGNMKGWVYMRKE